MNPFPRSLHCHLPTGGTSTEGASPPLSPSQSDTTSARSLVAALWKMHLPSDSHYQDLLGLLLCGKDIEPMWGRKELLKFIILVNFITSILAFVIAVALYYITSKESFLTAPLSGFHGVLAGFLVALKQILPNLELPMCFFWKIKAKAWLELIDEAIEEEDESRISLNCETQIPHLVSREDMSCFQGLKLSVRFMFQYCMHHEFHLRWGCREIHYEKPQNGEAYVTGKPYLRIHALWELLDFVKSMGARAKVYGVFGLPVVSGNNAK